MRGSVSFAWRTGGPLIGGGSRVYCGGWTGGVGWDEGFHFCCLEDVVTGRPLVGGGTKGRCGGWDGGIGWDEGLPHFPCCLCCLCMCNNSLLAPCAVLQLNLTALHTWNHMHQCV